MTEIRTYEGFIEEAYLKCLRSVLIIDDDYPTLDGLIQGMTASKKAGTTEKKWSGAKPQDVLAVIKGFREQEPPLIVDIHDGSNVGVAPELRVADHLHQSDLLVLDFELVKAKRDDGTSAINILRKLAQNPHFNLVMMHSSLEPERVFEDVVLGLIHEEIEFGDADQLTAALEEVEVLDPDLPAQLRTALFQDNAAFLEARIKPHIISDIDAWKAQPFAGFSSLCEQAGIGVEIRPHVLAKLLDQKQEALKERFWTEKSAGALTYSHSNAPLKWVKLNTLFIGFTKKTQKFRPNCGPKKYAR